MWRRHLAVWATHPLLHGWHRTIADLCRWPVLVAAGLVAYLAAVAGSALEMADAGRGTVWAWGPDAVVATWAVGTVVLFTYGQLVIVPRVTGHAARARRPSCHPAGVHDWTPSRQVPTSRPTARYLSGRAPVEVAR